MNPHKELWKAVDELVNANAMPGGVLTSKIKRVADAEVALRRAHKKYRPVEGPPQSERLID